MTDKYIDTGFALLGGFLSWFFGGLDGLMILLVVFVIADFLTGIMRSYLTRTLSSELGFHGIAKKICMFLLIGIANVIDNELLAKSELLRDAVVMFYLANEGLSITENSIDIGLPIPEALKERFMSWRTKELTNKNPPDIDD